MRKIPISGGPHAGKTTLLNALRAEYPDAYFVEEPAKKVIAAELAREEREQAYRGTFPWNNYKAFSRLVLNASVELEAAIPSVADLVFQDRSIIDNVGYNKLNELYELLPEITERIEAANYAFALFCQPVGTYTLTVIRRETPEEAQLTHEALADAYDNSGLMVVHLPAVTVPERLNLIREVL